MKFSPIIDLLRCPVSKQRLSFAEQKTLELIEDKRVKGKLFKKSGEMVKKKIKSGFLTKNKDTLYPIDEGIPQLLGPEGIPLKDDSSKSHIDIRLPQYLEPYSEMNSYDDIATSLIDLCDTESTLSKILVDDQTIYNKIGEISDTFPKPNEIWLDAKGCVIAQEEAYQYLLPFSGTRVLQIGGHGSHLIKFLLAGAKEAWLVSPMINELRLGYSLSNMFGLEDRFFSVQGIAEELPVENNFFDRVYSGGCLHHTIIEMTGQEVKRVMRSNGKASFVDPVMTLPYQLFVKPFYSRGIGRVDKAECSPILKEKATAFLGFFEKGSINTYRTFVHLPLIMATRYLKIDLRIRLIKKIEEMDRMLGKALPFLRDRFAPIACLCVKK